MVTKHKSGQTWTPPLPTNVRVIRHAAVCQKLAISSAKLFDMIAKGQFPRPFPLIPGGRAVGWLESSVDSWILARETLASRDGV